MINLTLNIKGYFCKTENLFYVKMQDNSIGLIETFELEKNTSRLENNTFQVLGDLIKSDLKNLPAKVTEFFLLNSKIDEKQKSAVVKITLKGIWKLNNSVYGFDKDKKVYRLSEIREFFRNEKFYNVLNGAKGFSGNYYKFPKGRTLILENPETVSEKIPKEII